MDTKMKAKDLQNGLQKLISPIKAWFYLRQKESIVERLNKETQREEARAEQLRQILEAKQKLVSARAKTRQLVKDIDAVGYPTKKQ